MAEDDKSPITDNLNPIQRRIIGRRTLLKNVGGGLMALATSGLWKRESVARAQTEPIFRPTTEIPPLPEFKEVSGHQNIMVILTREKQSPPPITKEQEVEVMQRVAEFYKRSSYGRFTIGFEVMDWLDLPHIDPDAKNIDELARQIDQGIMSASYLDGALAGRNLLKEFQTRLYLIAKGESSKEGYGWGGQGEKYHRAWIYQPKNSGDNEDVTKHEVGHTLGLGHVTGLRCKEEGDYTNNCQLLPYAGFSVMARGMNAEIAGPQKLSIGWIKPEQVVTVTKDAQEVEITPLEKAGGNKLIRIYKGDGEFYYVDFSANPEREDWIPSVVNYYLWDEKNVDFKDLRPEGPDLQDKINNIKIQVLNKTDDKATFLVKTK